MRSPVIAIKWPSTRMPRYAWLYRGGNPGGDHLVAHPREEDLEFVRWLHGFDGEHGNPIALRNKRE